MANVEDYYNNAAYQGIGEGKYKHLYMTLYLWKNKKSSEIMSGISLKNSTESGIFRNEKRERLSFIEKFPGMPNPYTLIGYIQDKFLKGFANNNPQDKENLRRFLLGNLVNPAIKRLETSLDKKTAESKK